MGLTRAGTWLKTARTGSEFVAAVALSKPLVLPRRNIPKSWNFLARQKQASFIQAKEPWMKDDTKLFFNLLARDALLIFEGEAHLLEGPFSSREDAERASEQLMARISKATSTSGGHAAASRDLADLECA